MKKNEIQISEELKQKIYIFEKSLNLLQEQGPNYKITNRLYAQEIIGKKMGLLRKVYKGEDKQYSEIARFISAYKHETPDTFKKLINSIKNNNFTINHEEIELITKRPDFYKLKEVFELQFKISFEKNKNDNLDVQLFKAICQEDQEQFELTFNSNKLDKEMRVYVIEFLKWMAANYRDIECIRFFVKNKIDVTSYEFYNSCISELQTGSLLADALDNQSCNSEYLHKELIDTLIQNGADINFKGEDSSPFFVIIELAEEDYCMKLLSTITNINETESFNVNNSYLTKAIIAKKYVLAKALIEKGADLSFKDILSGRGVLETAIKGKNLDFIKYILEQKIETDFIHKSKYQTYSYLRHPIENKNLDLFKLLVQHGADINYCNKTDKNIWQQIIHNDQMARFVVKTGKLKLGEDENNNSVEYYTKIKMQIDLEKKCEKDIVWLESKGVGAMNNLQDMLKYYVNDYKTYFKQNDFGQDKEFFQSNTGKVIDAIKAHIKLNWFKNIAKIFRVNSYDYENEIELTKMSTTIFIPKNPLFVIGEFLFDEMFKEANMLGELKNEDNFVSSN